MGNGQKREMGREGIWTGRENGYIERENGYIERENGYIERENGQKHKKQEKRKSAGKGKGVHKSGKAVPGCVTLL